MANSGVFELIAGTALHAADVFCWVDTTDATQSANGSLKKITVTNVFASIPVPVVVTSASANALAVGLTGNTNSAFKVDASTALQVAGLKVTGAVTTGTVAIVVTDSGAVNTNLSINALNAGTIGIGSVSTGRVTITPVTTITGALTLSAALTYGGVTLSNAVTGTGNMVLSASPTFTGTITAAIANFSGAVSTAGLTCTTLAGTGAVSGFTTAHFTGLITGDAGLTVTGANITVGAGQQLQWAATSGTLFFGLFGGGDELGVSKAGLQLFKVNFNGTVTVPNGGLTVSAGTTAVQALTATTAQFATGAANNILFGQNPSSTSFNAISLSGSLTLANVIGFTGGGTGNSNLFFESPTGGGHHFRINVVDQLVISATGAVFTAGISATTGTFSGAAGASFAASTTQIGFLAGGAQWYSVGSDTSTNGVFTLSSTRSNGTGGVIVLTVTTVGMQHNQGGLGLSNATIPSNGIAFGGSAPGVLANGQMWYDGTDFKVRTGGVTKTITIA